VTRAQVTYRPRPGATPAAELSALSAVYKFVLETKKAAKPAPEPDSRIDAAIVRSTKEVRHVEQGPHRPSEIVVNNSLKEVTK
jgi:hypothetical protein